MEQNNKQESDKNKPIEIGVDRLNMFYKATGDAMFETYQLLGNEVVDVSGLSKEEIRKMVDNCTKKVKYNPSKMWFDYQALFDKTRDKILGKPNNIEVKHVDFDKDLVATQAVFNDKEVWEGLLNAALDGDLKSQDKILDNINIFYNLNEDDIAYINYLFFITIQIALGDFSTTHYNEYYEEAYDDYIPTYFSMTSLKTKNNEVIKKMNFYAIVRPVLGSIFFDKNFY